MEFAQEEQINIKLLEAENLKMSAIAKAKILKDLEELPDGAQEKLR